LEIVEKQLGPDHPHVATSLNNLALLLQDQGNYAAAEPLYRRAIAILEKTLGPEHPNTKTARKNLEILLSERSR
jgi:tetratricopeptide (TPR) repeat protein